MNVARLQRLCDAVRTNEFGFEHDMKSFYNMVNNSCCPLGLCAFVFPQDWEKLIRQPRLRTDSITSFIDALKYFEIDNYNLFSNLMNYSREEWVSVCQEMIDQYKRAELIKRNDRGNDEAKRVADLIENNQLFNQTHL